MAKKTIEQAGAETFRGKRVLVRVDFNVPQREDLSVADDSRIRAALPTIEWLRDAGAKVILVSHLGRPKGEPSQKYSLQPVAERLCELLDQQLVFLTDSIGPAAHSAVSDLKNGQVCLLENIRFHPGEESNDPEFARQLASLADIYVNDAFGTAHRAHASTEGVTKHISPALSGFLMHKELEALSGLLQNPARPFATIIGGSKVSSKIGVLEKLVDIVDVLVIGGAMAFSFLKAEGKQVGKSLVEEDRVDFCRQLQEKAAKRGVDLILPIDVVCAPEMRRGVARTTVSVDAIPSEQMGLDVGPDTTKLISKKLATAKTILWNGPLGVFEVPGFETSTYALIDTLVKLTQGGAKTVIGGGDSVAAIEAKGVKPEAFTHVSTGGGASLEFIEGIELPGVACLDEAEPVSARRGK